MYRIKESSDNYIVFKQNKSVAGSESMVLLANGVKAKCVLTEKDETIITEFLFDKNKFTKESAKTWTRQHAANMEKGLQESAPKGSFLDTTLKFQDALNASILFPKDENGNSVAYVTHMFEDHAIVSQDGKDFKVNFKINSDNLMELESPVEVRPEFVTESGAEKKQEYFDLHEMYSNTCLKEVKFDKKSRKLVATLIEKGMNYDKRRFYPDDTIKEAAPLFAGIKMFIDHPTDKEDREKPERSVRDEVGIIEKSWYEDGKIMAQIHIHDEWLAEKLTDKVFRENIGISINASGKRSLKTIDGMQVEVIEKIASPRSVDWVTEAGARGRVEYLIESAKQKKGDTDMLKTLTLTEVKKDRPDLVESIREEVKAELKEANAKAIKEAVEAEVKSIKEKSDESLRQAGYQTKVKGLLEKTSLHPAGIMKLCEEFKSKTFKSESELEDQVKEAASTELKYISSISGKAINSEAGNTKEEGVYESATKRLKESLGIKEDKKDEE